jgi:hypothetical protein
MWIYEVNIRLEKAIEIDYRAWLAKHIEQVKQAGGFTGAMQFDVESDEANHVGLCVHYQAASREAISAYVQYQAPLLRADGVQRFGDRFSATRRIMRAHN